MVDVLTRVQTLSRQCSSTSSLIYNLTKCRKSTRSTTTLCLKKPMVDEALITSITVILFLSPTNLYSIINAIRRGVSFVKITSSQIIYFTLRTKPDLLLWTRYQHADGPFISSQKGFKFQTDNVWKNIFLDFKLIFFYTILKDIMQNFDKQFMYSSTFLKYDNTFTILQNQR